MEPRDFLKWILFFAMMAVIAVVIYRLRHVFAYGIAKSTSRIDSINAEYKEKLRKLESKEEPASGKEEPEVVVQSKVKGVKP